MEMAAGELREGAVWCAVRYRVGRCCGRWTEWSGWTLLSTHIVDGSRDSGIRPTARIVATLLPAHALFKSHPSLSHYYYRPPPSSAQHRGTKRTEHSPLACSDRQEWQRQLLSALRTTTLTPFPFPPACLQRHDERTEGAGSAHVAALGGRAEDAPTQQERQAKLRLLVRSGGRQQRKEQSALHNRAVQRTRTGRRVLR